MERRKKKNNRNKRIDIRKVFLVIIVILIAILFNLLKVKKDKKAQQDHYDIDKTIEVSSEIGQVTQTQEIQINDWNLKLVNKDNILPKDFQVELSNIDKIRKFDKRAISYLQDMMREARNDGITNIWVQSAYRSIDKQYSLYYNRVNQYLKNGKNQEEAEKLTQKTINKPGASEHNLGLAIDFNKVTKDFENTSAFKWLVKNAEKYGFILRYKKEKENITYVDYEPWHWRYVGKEHAKAMNEKQMCLEEYIEYLKGEKQNV